MVGRVKATGIDAFGELSTAREVGDVGDQIVISGQHGWVEESGDGEQQLRMEGQRLMENLAGEVLGLARGLFDEALFKGGFGRGLHGEDVA